MSTNKSFPLNKSAIHNTVQIIKQVMLSVAEAKLGILYIDSKLATQMQLILTEIGHPQPLMPIYEPTVPLPMLLSPTKSSSTQQKQWTGDFTGYTIANSETISFLIATRKNELCQLLLDGMF